MKFISTNQPHEPTRAICYFTRYYTVIHVQVVRSASSGSLWSHPLSPLFCDERSRVISSSVKSSEGRAMVVQSSPTSSDDWRDRRPESSMPADVGDVGRQTCGQSGERRMSMLYQASAFHSKQYKIAVSWLFRRGVSELWLKRLIYGLT